MSVAMMACSVTVVAQTTHSLTVGFSPVGNQKLYLTNGKKKSDTYEKHSYKYKSYWIN